MKLYDVVIADPPWAFKVYSDKGAGKSPKYQTMSASELRAFGARVRVHCAKNCVLYLWATSPFLAEALTLMAEWGWQYKSSLVWCKPHKGTGYWVRNNHELVLVGTRGKPKCPAPAVRQDSVFVGPAVERRHSSKPATIHNYVELWYPSAHKLELFARTRRAGWDAFGNEVGGSVALECPKNAIGNALGRNVRRSARVVAGKMTAPQGASKSI